MDGTHINVKNENGSIIIICMIVLLLLTLFGVSAITTTVIETKIAGNERRQQKVFYAAESGWHLAAKWIDNQWPLPIDDLGLDADVDPVTFIPANFDAPETFVLDSASEFSSRINFVKAKQAKGYSKGFMRFFYKLRSIANDAQNTNAKIVMGVSKIDLAG